MEGRWILYMLEGFVWMEHGYLHHAVHNDNKKNKL